jgi:hypothetical protein
MAARKAIGLTAGGPAPHLVLAVAGPKPRRWPWRHGEALAQFCPAARRKYPPGPPPFLPPSRRPCRSGAKLSLAASRCHLYRSSPSASLTPRGGVRRPKQVVGLPLARMSPHQRSPSAAHRPLSWAPLAGTTPPNTRQYCAEQARAHYCLPWRPLGGPLSLPSASRPREPLRLGATAAGPLEKKNKKKGEGARARFLLDAHVA